MLAINLAIKAGMWIWDELNTTLEEQQEIVDNLSSEISSLEEEEKKLLAHRDEGGLTEAEQSRLDYLQQRLELDQKIYEQEQRKLAENELYGKGDLLNEGLIGNNFGEGKVTKSAEKYYTTMFYIKTAQKQLDTYTKAAQDAADAGNTFLANLYNNNIDKSEQKLQNYKSTLLDVEKEYLDYASTIKKYLDAGVWDNDQEEKTKMEQLYQDYLNMANKIESDVLTVNVKLEEVDADSLKKSIKHYFVGTGVDFSQNKSEEDYINGLSNEELQTVSKGIEDKTIVTISDMKNAVDEYRKAKEKCNEEELESPTFSSSIKSASELASKLDDLSKIYEDVKNGDTFDFTSLGDSDFIETFGKYTDEYQKFVDTVTSSPSDIKACQSAFDNLVTAWVKGSGVLDNLTEENKDYYVALLESKGIVNASTVVNTALAATYVQQANEAAKAGQSTDEYANKIRGLGLSAQDTQMYMYSLQLATIAANNAKLDFTQQIAECNKLAQAAGLASAMLNAAQSQRSIAQQLQAEGISYAEGVSSRRVAALQEQMIGSYVTDLQGRIAAKVSSTVGVSVSGTKSSSGSGGGSSEEAYKAEIDALEKYTDAYEEAKAKREAIDKKYDNAKTNEEKLALMKDRITAMKEEQKAIEALNDARDKEIQKNVKELKSKGFKVTYDPYTDKLQIDNMEHLNELKGKDRKTTNELIKKYEELIKDTKDMASSNKDLATTWQDNNYTLQKYNDELQTLRENIYDDFNTKIELKIDIADNLNEPQEKLKLLGEQLQNTVNSLNRAYKEGLDSTSSYVQKLIKDLMSISESIKEARKQAYEDQKDKYDSAKNAVLAVIDKNIEALQKEKEELEALNDEQDRALNLAKAKEALSKAEQNKVIHVYRRGIGWTYEADEQAIKDAKKDLADLENEEQINALDKKIDKLNDYKDAWDKITDKWQEAADKLDASNLFGNDWENKVNNMTLSVEDFGDKYYNVCDDINRATKETAQDILNEYKDLFGDLWVELERFINPKATTHQAKYFYATKDGTAPNGATYGDRILTQGGTYEIVKEGTKGAVKNDKTGLYSIKVDDVKTAITDANAGTLAYTRTIEELNDEVVGAKNTMSETGSKIDDNTSSNILGTSATKTNTSGLSDNSDELTDNTDELTNIPDYISEGIENGSKYLSDTIAKAIANGDHVIGMDDYVIGMDGEAIPSQDIPIKDGAVPVLINEETYLKGLEKLKEILGENNESYKAAYDNYLSLWGNKDEKVSGANANKNAGYANGALYKNFNDFFESFNASYKGTIGGKKWYEYMDVHGHTTAANEDYFKTNYILGRTAGYTDRERAQNILDKINELDMLDDMLSSYHEFTMRMLDIVNTPEGGSRKATTMAREYTKRAYEEIRNAKNGSSNSIGSYDSSGKKTTSVSYDRNGNIVSVGYSDKAPVFNPSYVDKDKALKDEDVFKSPFFKEVSDAILSGDKYFNYENKNPNNNVDMVRAYDTSYNKQYDSLKLATDKTGKETRTNSERLANNSDAMNTLTDEIGDSVVKLEDSINGVVKVLNSKGEIAGTINTKTGEFYRSGSSGSKSSSSSSSGWGSKFISKVTEGFSKATKQEVEVSKNKDGNGTTTVTKKGGKVTSVTVTRHAKGTGKVKNPHFAVVDDEGTELVMRSDSNGRGTYLEYGDKVFPHEESKAILDTYEKVNDYPEGFVPVSIPDIFKNANIQDTISPVAYPTPFNGNFFNIGKELNNLRKELGDTIYQYDFDKLVLPNVTDANSLLVQLKNLKSEALQRSNKR